MVEEQSPPDTASRRILVVDDDFDVRTAIASALEAEGYDIIEAYDGANALERLRDDHSPSLILLDLMMPVLDGWNFRERQLADPRLAHIPVIVMSASGLTRPLPGIHEFLKKPVSLDRLLSVVEAALP